MMGKVIMSGIVPPLVAPVTGILAGDLAVGSSVYLMENGSAVEYLVVNQGIPSGSSLYDSSCDGTWLLRKDIFQTYQWSSSNVNDYANSIIHKYLNNTFFGLFGSTEQSVIKQVKIPYREDKGWDTSANTGSRGLSVKLFLLSGREVGFTHNTFPSNEGTTLTYFDGCATDGADSKRIAYMDGTATKWWMRSPSTVTTNNSGVTCVNTDGSWIGYNASNWYGLRPAVIIDSNTMFDTKTLIPKGVS